MMLLTVKAKPNPVFIRESEFRKQTVGNKLMKYRKV